MCVCVCVCVCVPANKIHSELRNHIYGSVALFCRPQHALIPGEYRTVEGDNLSLPPDTASLQIN